MQETDQAICSVQSLTYDMGQFCTAENIVERSKINFLSMMSNFMMQSLNRFTAQTLKTLILRQRNLSKLCCLNIRIPYRTHHKALQRPEQTTGPCRTFALKYITTLMNRDVLEEIEIPQVQRLKTTKLFLNR